MAASCATYAGQFPVTSRGKQAKGKGSDEGSDWDESSGSSAPAAKETTPKSVAKPTASKPTPKKKVRVSLLILWH